MLVSEKVESVISTALLGMPGFGARDNLHELDAYTIVHPTGDPIQDAMNIRHAVDGVRPVLLKSQDMDGNPQSFHSWVVDHLEKDCTVYLQDGDGPLKVIHMNAHASTSHAVRVHSVSDRKPPEKSPPTRVSALQLYPVTVLEGIAGYLYNEYGLVARPPSVSFLSGIDIDSDSHRKIVFKTRAYPMYPLDPPAQIYESVGDNRFQGYTTSIDRWHPLAVGDSDSDGLQEIITGEFDHGPWLPVVGIYEQLDAFSYPTAKTTEFLTPKISQATPPIAIAIDDLDGDHLNEIIYTLTDTGTFTIHEATGDDSYEQKYVATTPPLHGALAPLHSAEHDNNHGSGQQWVERSHCGRSALHSHVRGVG